jgi:hypothetical protein
MIVKTSKNRRNRNALDPSNIPVGTLATPTCTLVANKVQIDFDLAVSCSGLPVGITVQGLPPTAFVQNTLTRITLTYAANVVATNVCVIPSSVPQLRTRNGGFVNAKSTTF